MKKLILLSLAAIGIASVASATPVNCEVLMAANTMGGSSNTCTVTPDPGDFISSLTLTGADDYTGFLTGNPVVAFSATLVQSSPVFSAPTFCSATTSGVNSVSCAITVSPSTVTGLDITTPYSLNLINAANTVTGGGVTGASITLALSFTESPITSSTPEPATLGLTGMALLGVGFLARRKGKARV